MTVTREPLVDDVGDDRLLVDDTPLTLERLMWLFGGGLEEAAGLAEVRSLADIPAESEDYLKVAFDDCETLDALVATLRRHADRYERLARNGWVLAEPIDGSRVVIQQSRFDGPAAPDPTATVRHVDIVLRHNGQGLTAHERELADAVINSSEPPLSAEDWNWAFCDTDPPGA